MISGDGPMNLILLSFKIFAKLKFSDKKNQLKDTMMGWNGGSSTISQIELKFSSKEEAVNYAKKNRIDYEVLETSERKVINKSYADNFK